MKRWSTVGSFALAALLFLPAAALAQEGTGGRTDGPEGSEIGHGGYTKRSGGKFSLQLDFGAKIPTAPNRVPLFAGLTGGFWVDEWFVVDATALYSFDQQTQIQVGPRFRTITYPMSANIGVKAGATVFNRAGVVAFTVSPQAGADFVLNNVLFGLSYAIDLSFLTSTPSVGHRVFMSLGYRF
jgi:hypothetical protein